MAVRLTQKELDYFKDLEENFESHVADYQRQKMQEYTDGLGLVSELREELKNHRLYLEGCRNWEIDDVVINIRFIAAKIKVLEDLLESGGN